MPSSRSEEDDLAAGFDAGLAAVVAGFLAGGAAPPAGAWARATPASAAASSVANIQSLDLNPTSVKGRRRREPRVPHGAQAVPGRPARMKTRSIARAAPRRYRSCPP